MLQQTCVICKLGRKFPLSRLFFAALIAPALFQLTQHLNFPLSARYSLLLRNRSVAQSAHTAVVFSLELYKYDCAFPFTIIFYVQFLYTITYMITGVTNLTRQFLCLVAIISVDTRCIDYRLWQLATINK